MKIKYEGKSPLVKVGDKYYEPGSVIEVSESDAKTLLKYNSFVSIEPAKKKVKKKSKGDKK